MDIKEFISKVKIYNEGWHFETLLEALAHCIECEGCPFFNKCAEKRGTAYSCEEMLKEHLTTN